MIGAPGHLSLPQRYSGKANVTLCSAHFRFGVHSTSPFPGTLPACRAGDTVRRQGQDLRLFQ